MGDGVLALEAKPPQMRLELVDVVGLLVDEIPEPPPWRPWIEDA
jgi:hypothetical protein